MTDRLASDGTIKPALKSDSSFWNYFRDIWSTWWFYSSIVVALLEVFLVITNVQAGVALFFRIVFGLGILGIIPGFLTTLLFFPKGQLVTLERIAMSIFLSVMISIAVGVLLGLGPYFQASNNVVVLAGYVVLVDIAASYRAYQFSRTLL